MKLENTHPTVRLSALAVAAVIATALFATIVGHMPPDFAGAPNGARNGTDGLRTEVAIVPSRIEVVGVRGAETAANEDDAHRRPRS